MLLQATARSQRQTPKPTSIIPSTDVEQETDKGNSDFIPNKSKYFEKIGWFAQVISYDGCNMCDYILKRKICKNGNQHEVQPKIREKHVNLKFLLSFFIDFFF